MGALIACAVFIIYTATSGLFGVIYTDVFQFVMLILFVYILIPGASLVKLGGPAAFFPQSCAGAGDALRRRHDHRGYHHLLCVHARGRGDVAARLCGEKPEGGKRTGCFSEPWHMGLRSLSCGSWALSHTSSSARKRSPCTEPPTPSFRRLPLDPACRSHGACSRWDPLRHHVHGGQLSDRVGAKLRARCL